MLNKIKFYVALLGALAITATEYFAEDSDVSHWLSIVIALCTAAGVYVFPNLERASVLRGKLQDAQEARRL